MSLVWIICGAGRHVGKTTFALQLCEILPDCVYAKCGHGKPKSDKPGDFFGDLAGLESFIKTNESSSKHTVVESNLLAAQKRGDIIIFIEGIEGKTDFRDDAEQLRAAADIVISPSARNIHWKKILSNKINSRTICDSVCDLLAVQKRFLFGSRPAARCKIWFEAAGAYIFGSGLATLLKNVDRRGTLQDAAKDSNMSYRYAWNLIRMAEHHFGKVLIVRHAGGQYGGSSKLSSDGLHFLEVFTKLNEQVADFTGKKFEELYSKGNINA